MEPLPNSGLLCSLSWLHWLPVPFLTVNSLLLGEVQELRLSPWPLPKGLIIKLNWVCTEGPVGFRPSFLSLGLLIL
jgi:hypothetical protein